MSRPPIYLDGFSTTPLAPEAKEAILQSWMEPGNAGSSHFAGELAAAKIFQARTAVGALIGATPDEIIFTSGATESNNLVVLGVGKWALAGGSYRRRIVISAIEHKAIFEPANALNEMGFETVIAPVTRQGVVDVDKLTELVDETTLLVSVMAANNETGAIQPLSKVVAVAHAVGAYVHSDAAQAAGKVPFDVDTIGVDYTSLSGHKIYGPMGVGALYVSQSAPRPFPIQYGGGQQGRLRPGTEPVALIVGFGKAAQVALEAMEEDERHCRMLANHFMKRLSEHQVSFSNTVDPSICVPGGLSLIIDSVEADDIVMMVGKQLSISTGSACSSGQVLPSHVLSAMGINTKSARNIFRLLFGRYNSLDDAEVAASVIASAVQKLNRPTGPILQ